MIGLGHGCGWSGLAGSLAEWGISLGSITAVGLSESEVEESIKLALKRSSFLFITGDTVSPEIPDLVEPTRTPVLTKPFTTTDLDALLKQIESLSSSPPQMTS